MISSLVEWLLRRDLRRAYRQVNWVGPRPSFSREVPVVLYANHHHFYDGHLLWLLLDSLDRPGILWMEDWDRFPFFAAVGVQPFPPDDDARRRATLRRTVRRLGEGPGTTLVYFPEGRLHAPHEGILSFPDGAFERLARLFPEATQWWPVAVHVVQTGDARPTAMMAGASPHDAPDGYERERLREAWERLRAPGPAHDDRQQLLDGRRAPNDQWDFSLLTPFFERYL